MNIFILRADSDQFRSLCFKNEADIDVIYQFNGKPITGWNPISVESDDEGDDLPDSDFPSFAGHIPIFSLHAVEALGNILETNGQLLPLDYSGGVYYAYNVTRLADALDEEHSDVVRFPTGRIMDIKRYSFVGENLDEGLTIFKLSPTPLLRVFVSDRFVEAVEGSKLSGFKFLPAI